MNKSIDKFQSCCNSFKSSKTLEKRVNKNLLKIKNNTKYTVSQLILKIKLVKIARNNFVLLDDAYLVENFCSPR